MSQHAQYQELKTEAVKWNSAIIDSIIYIRTIPTVTRQNAFCEKDVDISLTLALLDALG